MMHQIRRPFPLYESMFPIWLESYSIVKIIIVFTWLEFFKPFDILEGLEAGFRHEGLDSVPFQCTLYL
jgi:hypothetical protein